MLRDGSFFNIWQVKSVKGTPNIYFPHVIIRHVIRNYIGAHPCWWDSWWDSHLVRRVDSWWDGRTLGEMAGLLVRPLDSWWDFWTLGEINYHQDNNIQHWFWLQYRDQINYGDSDFGDLMMMLMPHSWYWWRDLSPASQTRHQHIWSPTSVTNIDVTENIEDSMSFK